MKFLKHFVIVSIVAFITLACKQENNTLENSILWKIEHPDLEKASYLLGTVHLLCEDDFFLPNKVLERLNTIDQLVLEIDISDPEVIQATLEEMTNGKKISEELNEEQFAKLDTFVQKIIGAPLQDFDVYGLASLYIIISGKVFTCDEIIGMETELIKLANTQNIPVASLETVKEQMTGIKKGFPPLESYRLIFLFEESKEDFNKAVQFYKKENIEETIRQLMKDKYVSPNARQHIVTNRNANWVAKMPEMMEAKSNLFAVGAGHLVGKDGVIQLLKEKGYKVTPVF